MEELVGTSVPVFIGLTVILFGGCAFLTGQAVANGWKPMWLAVVYACLLGLGDRFLVYALFDGELLTLTGYAIHAAILVAIALTSYRLTQTRRMVTQYPWLYERTGLFGWRERAGTQTQREKITEVSG